MVLPIVTYGSSILRKKCVDINEKTTEIEELINNMFDTVKYSDGVGLSANQVNHPLNLFVVNYQSESDNIEETFINPNIIEFSDEKDVSKEGCLSFPSLIEDIQRSLKIKIEYLDKNFNKKVVIYDDIIARIIQHEYDHIKGTLFIDKINPLKRKLISSKLTMIIKKSSCKLFN